AERSGPEASTIRNLYRFCKNRTLPSTPHTNTSQPFLQFLYAVSTPQRLVRYTISTMDGAAMIFVLVFTFLIGACFGFYLGAIF
ncbi:MAG: hypothetical protein U1A28_00740, partial [Patescibacteria group bacterium]|nr:hypothetical protein [Patescibacteria group bacterium]